MFTLRHYKDGKESIRSAKWIDYLPEPEGDSTGPSLQFGNGGPQEQISRVDYGRFEGGVVYVMNEEGKTVATYHLP